MLILTKDHGNNTVIMLSRNKEDMNTKISINIFKESNPVYFITKHIYYIY